MRRGENHKTSKLLHLELAMINEFSLCVLQGIPKQISSNLRQIQSHLRERKYFHKVWNFSLSNGSFEDVETYTKQLVSLDHPPVL